MSPFDVERTIEATDLTPISGVTDDGEKWLRRLAQHAEADSLALRLSNRHARDTDPVVFFDERSGCWWAGRYVGEITYQGWTLRILPRFGMPQLHRWMSRIWGVQLLATKGKYERSRIWLWELLAKIWETRLLAAAKHGLPTVRLDELHSGQTIRGRLQVRPTAREFSAGRQRLVSRTRNRQIDRHIGSVIVQAFLHLRQELRHIGDERSWMTQRGQNLIGQLQSHIGRGVTLEAATSNAAVRYTPITEGYRPVVDLSRALLRQHPSSSALGGSRDVIGVLIDMAEVWELYLYHLLHDAMPDAQVVHAGRDVTPNNSLLYSMHSGERLGGLKPDVLILAPRTNRLLGILDAKYKTTVPTADRPHGVLREDLYQLAAYLSAYGHPSEMLAGGLVFPATSETPNIVNLQSKSPWRLSASERRVWFFGLSCEATNHIELGMTQSERAFLHTVRMALDQCAGRMHDVSEMSGSVI